MVEIGVIPEAALYQLWHCGDVNIDKKNSLVLLLYSNFTAGNMTIIKVRISTFLSRYMDGEKYHAG